jgi:VWFA-related protein
VSDLKKEDFQLFDNDKPKTISAFSVETRGAQEAGAESPAEPAPGNAPAAAPALPRRIFVFLFDDMHIGFEDLSYVKKAGVKALDGALAGSDVGAVVSTSGKTNSGLTRDHAKLAEAIGSLQPRGQSRSAAGDCPSISYYQADLMLNKHDPTASADALSQVLQCDPGLDPQRDVLVAQRLAESAAKRALQLGGEDVRETFAVLHEVVRRMGPLPGERTLILVSSGFPVLEQESRAEESQVLDLAAQSNVTISALDARGLYTTALTASDDVHAAPAATQGEFRASTLRAAEDAMSELADGTGGTFFHNSNDLDAGFKTLTQAPESLYLLEISVADVKPDGAYHRLKVKVDQSGVQVQARRGYSLPPPEKHKK